ncbi:MAG: DUF3575 domain-containing protein [Chitinophagaceae bacterium]|nr:DUF3575 domain-containing protein [Chitinophagaceae bacterium]
MFSNIQNTSNDKTIYSLFPAITFNAFSKNTNAQELRLYGGVQVYGSVNGAFTGPGIGFENSIARHFTLNADLNAGFSSTGSAIEFKPAVQYYFKPQNRGFYIGPSFKYIRLNEKGNNEEYVDDLYSIGFNVGIKTEFKSKYVFLFNASPHATIGEQPRKVKWRE